MPQPIIYVDRSHILPGRLDELKAQMRELAAFVEANEPQLLAYQMHLSEDGRQMSVIHVHADRASLEAHLVIAGPAFAPFAALIRLVSIDVYGSPGESAEAQLREKAAMLGGGRVLVHPFQAGFARLGAA
ncbi:MAG TPA: hypothetical protein VFK38_02190 [Candidatus Limnocylindrales bacterium]|nr:hypothetical protein [Candidatus Limnocylindrales bacterium]